MMTKRLSKKLIADKRFKTKLSHKEEKLRHKIRHEKELLHYAKMEENYRQLHQRLKDSKHPHHKRQLKEASEKIQAHRKRIYKKHPYHHTFFTKLHDKPVSQIHSHMMKDREIAEPSEKIDYGKIKSSASESAEQIVSKVGNAVVGTAIGIGKGLANVASSLFAKRDNGGGGGANIDFQEDIRG